MSEERSVIAACNRVSEMLERALELAQSQYGSVDDPRAAVDARIQLMRYALATLRQRIQPALAPAWENEPPHVVLLGATNTGKSTVLNVLLGRPAAGVSERARFSQHPVAFRWDGTDERFLTAHPSRFASYERYEQQHPPRQSDADLKQSGYRPALGIYNLLSAGGEPGAETDTGTSAETGVEDCVFAAPATTRAIFWDVPDYSTEEALAYMGAVLDTLALADVVVMVVTSQSYANAIDMRMRDMVAASGLPLRVVANKLLPESHLLDDIAQRLGSTDDPDRAVLHGCIYPLPAVGRGREGAPVVEQLAETPEAHFLRDQIADDADQGAALKKKALLHAAEFLDQRFEEILAPLYQEVNVARRWREEVNRITEREFYDRYRRDYLEGQEYSDFNIAFLKALDYLEIPGVGRVLAGAAQFFRGVTKFVWNVIRSPFSDDKEEQAPPEQQVLKDSFASWLNSLLRFTQEQAQQTRHPEWVRLAQQMGEASFQNELAMKLGPAWKAHRAHMERLIEERAQSVYGQIEQNPALRNTLRTVKFTTDAVTVGGVVVAGGLDVTDFVIGPGVAVLLRLLYEKGGEQLAETQKRRLKEEQFAALRGVLEEHMVEPTRQLFRTSTSQQELETTKADYQHIKWTVAETAQR